jgi:hypothetical protein
VPELKCEKCGERLDWSGGFHAVDRQPLHSDIKCGNCGAKYKFFEDGRLILEAEIQDPPDLEVDDPPESLPF